jgi:hydrogenase-4 component F
VAESTLLIWLFTAPALAALAEYALGKKFPAAAGKAAILGSTATLGLAVAMTWRLLQGVRLLQGFRLVALGNQLHADPFAAFVALVVSFVGWMATIFAYSYLRREVAEGKIPVERLPLYFIWSMIFLSTMTAVTVDNNIIMMYVLVEATTLASALLVTLYWNPASLEAGYKYLLLCSVGITMGLLGCVVIYSAAVPFLGGHNAMLITEIATVAHRFPPAVVLVAGVLVIIGFGSKAGVVPFHAWVPDAYSQSPSPVAALFSGVTNKVAIYAIARIATIFYPGHSALGQFAMILGAVTMLTGIVVAYQQTDLKRMLAYSSVSQIGYVLMGLGIGSYLGFYGGIYHLLNHALNKSMLFLCSGALLYVFGTTDMDELGKKKHSRVLAVCFFIGALGIAGMPPLIGFWSKFAIYTAAAKEHLWWLLGIALFTSLLTMAVMIRAGARIFLQSSHANGEHADELAATAQPLALAMAAGAGHASGLAGEGIQLSSGTKLGAEADAAPARRCPTAMTAVIVLMTLLVLAAGLNLGIVNRLIDLSVRALLQQMAGG